MNQALKDRFIALVGAGHALIDEHDVEPHLREWRGRWTGRAAAVLQPDTTDEVAAILKLATETGTPVVPQGGNTGLVGGQIPDGTGKAIVISTTRMNRIREIDLEADTMTVEAGVVLETIHNEADARNRLVGLNRGDALLFLDADMRLPAPDFLSRWRAAHAAAPDAIQFGGFMPGERHDRHPAGTAQKIAAQRLDAAVLPVGFGGTEPTTLDFYYNP